jgi:hypothetical protein
MKVARLAVVVLSALVVLGGAAVFAACGDGDGEPSAEEIQEVEDLVRQLFESSGDDADFVFAHVTDNMIENVFFSTREECMANADECIGDPASVESVSDTEIDGNSATTHVVSDFGVFDVTLVREDDVWKADSLRAASDEVPEGAAIVNMSLIEFTFAFRADDIPADGNFAFRATNDGEQVHEVGVAPIPADVPLEEAIEAVDESAVVAFKLFIVPDQEVDVAFDAPLEPGRYALVCFFPDTDDPERTPHAFKGMLAEFTIE